MTAHHLIDIKDLGKVFHTDDIETWALNNVDLTIDRGEYVAISGPSGCGKSTLLSVIGLLSSPTKGQYLLDGKEVASLRPSEQARVRNQDIGFIFQAFNLIGDMDVFDNIELPLTFGAALGRKERRDRVVAALEQVGMGHRLKHRPSQLSGGQQQRVAIARALVTHPKVLLADEPTGNLDSTNAELVLELLASLHAAGSTIVMVTHDARSAAHANRTISMSDGHVVSDTAVLARARPMAVEATA